jgi:hypothetical protein
MFELINYYVLANLRITNYNLRISGSVYFSLLPARIRPGVTGTDFSFETILERLNNRRPLPTQRLYTLHGKIGVLCGYVHSTIL